jgi:hypothetical protein
MKRKRKNEERKVKKRKIVKQKCSCVLNQYDCNCHSCIDYIKSVWEMKNEKFKIRIDEELIKMSEFEVRKKLENLPILLHLDPMGGSRKIFGKIQKVKAKEYYFKVICLLDLDKDWTEEFDIEKYNFRVKYFPHIPLFSYECIDQHDFKFVTFEEIKKELKEEITKFIKTIIKSELKMKMRSL